MTDLYLSNINYIQNITDSEQLTNIYNYIKSDGGLAHYDLTQMSRIEIMTDCFKLTGNLFLTHQDDVNPDYLLYLEIYCNYQSQVNHNHFLNVDLQRLSVSDQKRQYALDRDGVSSKNRIDVVQLSNFQYRFDFFHTYKYYVTYHLYNNSNYKLIKTIMTGSDCVNIVYIYILIN